MTMEVMAGYNVIVLTEKATDSRAVLCPERGGILIQLTLHGKDILYLQEETFADPAKNIRGGNPVLFPICGPLPNNEYQLNGHTYTMRQHGFARNKAWKVIDQASNWATLQLQDDEESFKQYPFHFSLEFTYKLEDGKLSIYQTYKNLSSETMPFYAGFHPYFNANHPNSRYEIPATQYVDNEDGITKKYEENLKDLPIQDAKNFNPVSEGISRLSNNQDTIEVEYSNDFTTIVVWSERPDQYVCLEPWMALPGGFEQMEGVVRLPAHEELQAKCSISIKLG